MRSTEAYGAMGMLKRVLQEMWMGRIVYYATKYHTRAMIQNIIPVTIQTARGVSLS